MIEYRRSLEGVTAERLGGFFEGWPNPPSPERHLELLAGSAAFVLAVDSESAEVVGFVNALSDGVLTAYVPLLEVRPAHRGRGIGRELVARIIEALEPMYMIDLSCDAGLIGFYEALGFTPGTAMLRRNYDVQAGRPHGEVS